MRHLLHLLILLTLATCSAPAFAQSQTSSVVGRPATPNAEQICGRDTSGNCRVPRVTATGELAVTGGGTGTDAQQVQGTAPSGSAPAGNPVLMGGLGGGTVNPLVLNPVNVDGVVAGIGNVALLTRAYGYLFNGTTWDRTRGDTSGAWVHAPRSTPTNVGGTVATSGTTVALTFTDTSDGEFVNPSAATFWCSWGTPAVNGAGSYPIVANGSYRPPSRVAGTWTCLSTAANQPYTFTRF